MDAATRPTSGWGTVADTFADRDPGRPVAKASLLDAVTDLRAAVAETRFPLPLDGVARARRQRAELLDQLDDHLLPRLRELSAPGLVVVAGSTGAGKSTLVNSLVREEVSQAGVLRPTTRRPMLVHHPADAELLAGHPLLAHMDAVARDAVPRGVALVDAPDLDSLLEENRETARRLLDAADLWLFCTTAARYGDALPWQVLDLAAERGAAMAMVLNRVPRDAVIAVRSDLLARLGEHGLSTVPLFLVPDVGPHEGLLPESSIAPVRRWLTVLAGADRAQGVIARTQRGALAALRPRVDGLADAVQAQVDAREALEAEVGVLLAGPAERAAAEVAQGAVARGPVRGAWAAHAGRGGALGTAWTSRRAGEARASALRAVGEEVLGAARVALAAARRAGETAVAAGVGDRLAAVELPDLAPGVAEPDADAQAWLDGAASRLRGADHRGVARLLRQAGETGAAVVLAAAALGLGASRVLLERAIGGEAARALADATAADLSERMRAEVLAAGARVRAGLDQPDLAPDAASRLRLRRAVLKEWT
ncbi:GTPase domain-containing protein [Isoptericola sp. b441]|uniref:GTPase domain-containing protein n=1 Tax=Actinotalea lenta TaxID=3064654 RepID=A0ABT9D9Q7_9CELL|nr:GTPase domain-containing protein [Isoptericola sp. b441]MDO8107226.1 GTPase domain-containing protein [Isoptericola sp. b441]